jgi:lysophospholipase L1-like esterase
MKTLLRVAAVAAAVCLPGFHAGAQTMTFSSANLRDSGHNLVSNATVYLAPVTSTGMPLSYKWGGGGQTTSTPIQTQATAGAFSVLVPDTNLTVPENVCFRVTAIDNTSGRSLLSPVYSCVQPSSAGSQSYWCTGSSCNFDNYNPNAAALTLQVPGLPGPPGGTVVVPPALTNSNAAIFGDSYLATYGSAWMPFLSSLTGLNFTLQDGRSGRPTQDIFENYSATPATRISQLQTALANIDVVVIELSTNDGQNVATLGSPGDPATASTEYGYVQNAISTLLTAKPGLSIIWIGSILYNTSSYGGVGSTPAMQAQLDTAISYVCAQNGVPYLQMSKLSGINSFNWSTYLRDGVHLTDAAYSNKFAPLIARELLLRATTSITGTLPTPVAYTDTVPVNIFDYTAVVDSNLVSDTTGALIPGWTGYTATPLMNLRGAKTIISNMQLAEYDPQGAGVAFYYANGDFLSGYAPGNPGVSAGTAVTVPTGAVYMRAWFNNTIFPSGNIANVMIMTGSVLPSVFSPYVAP